MNITCQHCSEEISLPEDHNSTQIECPACKQTVMLTTPIELDGNEDGDAIDELKRLAEESGLADLAHGAAPTAAAAAGFGAGILGVDGDDDSSDADDESQDAEGKETISLSEALREDDGEQLQLSFDDDDDFELQLDDEELQLTDEGAGGLISDAAGVVAGVGEDVSAGAEELLSDAAEGAADLAGDAADLAGDAVDAVSDTADGAIDLAGNAISGATGMAGDAIDGVGDLAGDALEGAGDLLGDVTDGAAEMAGDVMDVAGDAVDAVSDSADGAIDWVGDAVSGAGDLVGDAADGAAGMLEGVVDGISDLAGDAIESVGDAVGDVVEGASDLVAPLGGAAAAAAGAVIGGSLLGGGDDEDNEETKIEATDDDDFDMNLLDGGDEKTEDALSLESGDEFEFESVDDEPLEVSDFTAQPASTFDAEKPDGAEDTDEDGSWLSGELSTDDTNLDTEDTLLEASVDPVYDTESIEFSESSVRDVDEESAGYKSATSSAFDLEETVDRVEPTEVADEVETVAAADPFEFAQHPESGAVATSPTAGYTPGPVPKRSSFVGNLLKGALTALLVLTLTQLVAWWGFGSDPLGVATKLPAALQIVVPEKLVAKTPVLRNRPRPVQPIADADADSDADESDADAQDSGSVDNVGSGSNSVDVAAGEATSPADIPEEDIPEEDVAGVGTPTGNETPDLSGGFSVADNGASEPGIATPAGDDMAGLLGDSDAGAFNPDDENAGMSDLPGEGSESRPSDPDAVALDSSVTDEASGDDEDFGALLDMDDSDDSDAGTALGAVEPPVVEKSIFTDMGPRNARQVSRNDVAATIAAAEKAFNAFESARLLDSKDFGAVAKQFYISHCELAENATVVPRDGSEDILVGSRKLIERLQADESKHAFIANCARGWLSRGNNPTPGVVLAGTVDKISRAGELNRLTVKLMDVRKGKELNTPVTVVTRLDANEGRVAYGQGAKVIVFGTRVDNPAVNLPGYQGRDGVVVYVTDQFVTIP